MNIWDIILEKSWNKREKALESQTESSHGEESEAKRNAIESISEEEPQGRSRREIKLTNNSNDFRVNIP